MPWHPYIHFQGQCAEAPTFDARVFDAPEPVMMTCAEAPGIPAGNGGGRIVHGQMAIAGGVLRASDFPPGMDGDPQKAFPVTAVVPDPARAGARFDALAAALADALADGGAGIRPPGLSVFSAGAGLLRNRFGTHRIVMVDSVAPAGP